MASLDSEIRKVVHAQQEREPAEKRVLRTGTVATSTPGASDGAAAVTVSIRGSLAPTPWLAAYTLTSPPQQGDHVAIEIINGSPVITGRIVGTPTF